MDNDPENIDFDIDRTRLVTYWRLQGLVSWTLALTLLGVFLGFASGTRGIEMATPDTLDATPRQIVGVLTRGCLFGMAGGFACGFLIYLAMVHFQSSQRARNLSLSVEGAYLRYRSGGLFRRDRRIHFRAISDYSVIEGPILNLLGLKALAFTMPGGPQGATTVIPAVIDTDEVRDSLCRIDAARETH